MSQIPKSKRKLTSIEFFTRANDLRETIVRYINDDFNSDKEVRLDGSPNPNYWIVTRIRSSIYDYSKQMIGNLTQANTIRINSLYEYNERRRYMTAAIGNLEEIIQEIQFSIRFLGVKPTKYTKLIDRIIYLEKLIKEWRASDNKLLIKFKDQI